MQLCIVAGDANRKVLNALVPHADILFQRVVEERDILADDGHRGSEFIVGDALHGTSVEQYLATPRLVETRDQLGQRRFPTTAAAHEGHRLAWLEVQIEMLDEWRIHWVVSEGDITQFQFAQQFSFF